MPSLRDYFDDPQALQLFKGMSLLDQADVLQAVDPNLAREHLTNVHRHNASLTNQAEVEGGSSMSIPTVSFGKSIPGTGIPIPKFSMGSISTRPEDVAPVISAVPRALGTAGGNVPLVGAGLAAIGDMAGQGIEIAGGAREKYNPLETGAQAALGAIPGGFLAKTVKPSGTLATKGIGALEGAGVGTIAAGGSALAQGRVPDNSELATGLLVGGTLGGLSAQRQAQPRPDYTEKAHKQIYAAIQPAAADTREFSEHLNAALPYIYANRKGHVNTIADMEQAARGTMRRLWNLHIEPVIAMNSHAQVNTKAIAQSLRSRINRDTPKNVRKAIEEEAAKFDQPRTLGELSRILKETNAKTRGLQEASGKSARTLRTDPKTGWRFDQLNELRSALADEVGKITGQSDMYMKLRKDWGSLSEVADDAGEAAKRWEHQKKIEGAGALPGVQRVMKSVKGGLGFGGAAAVRRGLTEAAAEYMANPDRQIKGAFKRLRFGQRMSDQFPEPLPLPERRALPAMGETGEPSISDLQHIKPTKKPRKQLGSGFEGGTAQSEVIEGRASHYGQPTPEFEAAEQFRTLPNVTSRPTQKMLPPASGQTIQPASGEDLVIGQMPQVRKIALSGEAPQPSTYVALPSGQTGTIDSVSGSYTAVRLDQTGELKWVPSNTLSVFPNRRRSALDPAVIEESRRRAAEGGAAISERRRKTIGEGGEPSLADFHRYRLGDPKTADFIETFDRTTKRKP